MTRTYLPVFEGLTIFLLMIAVLLIRPQGLFGESDHSDGGEEGDLLTGAGGGVLTDAMRTKLGAAFVGLLALAPSASSYPGNEFYVILLNRMLIFAIFALSLDIVMGYTGLVPLGHTMFYGVGAYVAALVMIHVTSSFHRDSGGDRHLCAHRVDRRGPLDPCLRRLLRDDKLARSPSCSTTRCSSFSFTGGSDGLLGWDTFFGIAGVGAELGDRVYARRVRDHPEHIVYYTALALAVLSFLFARRFMNAPFGSVLQSISEAEERAEFLGYNVTTYKRRAFVMSGGMAGMAGGLLAVKPSTFIISPDQTLAWVHSGEVIVMTLLGGMGTLFGPMIGAGVFIGAEDVLSSYTEQWRMVIGTIFVLFGCSSRVASFRYRR